MVIELLNMIFTGITAVTAVLALIFGFFYFNKRMKIYYFRDNDNLKIICFNKGNCSCKIEKILYSIGNKPNKEATINNNECIINLEYYDAHQPINILAIDNYGRKYKIVYKSGD